MESATLPLRHYLEAAISFHILLSYSIGSIFSQYVLANCASQWEPRFVGHHWALLPTRSVERSVERAAWWSPHKEFQNQIIIIIIKLLQINPRRNQMTCVHFCFSRSAVSDGHWNLVTEFTEPATSSPRFRMNQVWFKLSRCLRSNKHFPTVQFAERLTFSKNAYKPDANTARISAACN